MDPSEEEEIHEAFLYGDYWYGTADWYRQQYPGFDDAYYEVFELFYSEHTVNEVGAENSHTE